MPRSHPLPYETQLKAGDGIQVYGRIKLRGLEEGQYLVKSVSEYYGNPVYQFTKPGSDSVVSVRFASVVDRWIRPANHPDHNRIEIIHNPCNYAEKPPAA